MAIWSMLLLCGRLYMHRHDNIAAYRMQQQNAPSRQPAWMRIVDALRVRSAFVRVVNDAAVDANGMRNVVGLPFTK